MTWRSISTAPRPPRPCPNGRPRTVTTWSPSTAPATPAGPSPCAREPERRSQHRGAGWGPDQRFPARPSSQRGSGALVGITFRMLFRRPLSLLGVLLRESVGVGLTRALVTRAGCAPSVPRRCRIRPAVLTAPGQRRRARGGRGGGLSAVRAILLAGAVRRAARTGGVLATPGLGIDPVRLGETLIDSITLLVDRGPQSVRSAARRAACRE